MPIFCSNYTCPATWWGIFKRIYCVLRNETLHINLFIGRETMFLFPRNWYILLFNAAPYFNYYTWLFGVFVKLFKIDINCFKFLKRAESRKKKKKNYCPLYCTLGGIPNESLQANSTVIKWTGNPPCLTRIASEWKARAGDRKSVV